MYSPFSFYHAAAVTFVDLSPCFVCFMPSCISMYTVQSLILCSRAIGRYIFLQLRSYEVLHVIIPVKLLAYSIFAATLYRSGAVKANVGVSVQYLHNFYNTYIKSNERQLLEITAATD